MNGVRPLSVQANSLDNLDKADKSKTTLRGRSKVELYTISELLADLTHLWQWIPATFDMGMEYDSFG